MRVALSIQARMASDRLPGKVMADIHGRPMLAHQIERLSHVRTATLVVATTTDPLDDAVARLAAEMGVACVRGSEDDLISRHLQSARLLRADALAIAGADDPLLDPALFETIIARYVVGDCDYVATRGWPLGLNAWIVGRGGLEEGAEEATDPEERAEALPWWDRRPLRYRRVIVDAPAWADAGGYRLTVDEQADLDLHRLIYESLDGRSDFTTAEIVAMLDNRPGWADMNRGIAQKWSQHLP